MSIKNFLLKKMMQSKMKNIPEKDQEKIIGIIEKNPELFQKMGLEIQQKMKEGKDQMTAATEVAQKYQEEIKKLSS